MSICSSTPQQGGDTNSSLLEGDGKMSCHAILKNLYEAKMDVILTICFKITAEIEITKHMFCPTLQTRTCIGILKSIIMFFHSFIAIEYAFTFVFFTVNSSINAAGDHLAGGSFMQKALN